MASQMQPDAQTSALNEPTIAQQLAWIRERYDIIASSRFGRGGIEQELYLGSAEPRICRYCDRGAPAVSFDQKAHALPGLIGNQWLFDLQECDQCNALFGSTIDAHFGRWSASWRALERTPNREAASPKFSAYDGTIQIESNDSNQMTIVEGMAGAGRYTIDPEAGVIEFKLTRRGFASHMPMSGQGINRSSFTQPAKSDLIVNFQADSEEIRFPRKAL